MKFKKHYIYSCYFTLSHKIKKLHKRPNWRITHRITLITCVISIVVWAEDWRMEEKPFLHNGSPNWWIKHPLTLVACVMFIMAWADDSIPTSWWKKQLGTMLLHKIEKYFLEHLYLIYPIKNFLFLFFSFF